MLTTARRPIAPLLAFACLLAWMAPLIALAPSASAGETVDLRPRFQVGQPVRFELTLRTRTHAPRELQELGMAMPSTELRMTLTMTPTEAGEPGDGAAVRLTIDELQYQTDTPEPVSFDSRQRRGSPPNDPGANPLHAAFAGFMQNPMTVRIDGRGNVTGVDAAAPSGLGAGGDPAGAIGGAVRQLFGPIITSAPQSGVARVGERWTTRTSMPGLAVGAGELTTTHHLVSAQRDRANIDVRGEFQTGAGGIGAAESRFNGEMVWDRRAQMIERYEGALDLTVRLPAGLDAAASENAGSIRLEQSMHIRRLGR
ncbi:MAG: hypothetical protein EA378_01315 [Phycisphaerales bacterium]|nr:MAG: hypothetical protein EA378_01315 [Phycisphaerales bacterium]